jgi:hypothetical protein
MSQHLVNCLLVIIAACVFAHHVFTALLRRAVAVGSYADSELFDFTNPVLTQGQKIPALKLKYMLPWIASPDLSVFGSTARFYLFVSRICSYLAILGLLLIVSTGLLQLAA